MGDTIPTHKRSIPILRTPIHPHRPRGIFQLTTKTPHSLSIRGSNSPSNYRGRLYRIRSPMRTNIILRGNRNHHYANRNPLRGKINYTVIVGKLLSIPTHPKPILLSSFPYPTSGKCSSLSTPNLPPPNRIV